MSEESHKVVEATPVEAHKPLTPLTLPSGAKILHTKCKQVKEVTPAIEALVQMLGDYLKTHQNDDPRPIGVAAPQFGEAVRIFSYLPDTTGDVLTIINPELVYEKKKRLVVETCLSIPGQTFTLKRGKVVKIRGTLIGSSTRTFKGHDITAQVFLHELDHLNGITIDIIGRRIK
jgi:peptide deformylase